MKWLIFSLIFLKWATAWSQSIEILQAQQQGKSIQLTYDLHSTTGNSFEIKAFYQIDGGEWLPMTSTSGAVGQWVQPGKGLTLVWEPLNDLSELQSDQVRFRLTASYPGMIEMVYVEGGTFLMGSKNEVRNEAPEHRVTLSSFEIGKYEVTQAQWRAVMGTNPSRFKGCDDCPVEKVSWKEVKQFIEKLNEQTGGNFRLPTEAEWEYAARGGQKSKGTSFAGSNDPNKVAWHRDNSKGRTNKVGQKEPNELGIYDMSGNVREWCQDWYRSNYYTVSAATDPQGPPDGRYRVSRGGSWLYIASHARVAHRYYYTQGYRSKTLGFRLAR
jgi:formylglycine-generating enzyme required for sulfatase activity